MVDVWTAIGFVVLGAILGIVGQLLRVLVGLKKVQDEAKRAVADRAVGGEAYAASLRAERRARTDVNRFLNSLLISVLVGAACGVLAAVNALGAEVNRSLLLSIVGAGYAGTDFIEGLLREHVPRTISAAA